MVKKLQKMAAKKNTAANGSLGAAFGSAIPAGLLDSQLAQNIKDSAQQIWAAGLGAFSKAQGEGGKVFEALVKEGVHLQKKTQSAAEDKLGAMASKMSGMAGDVGSKAGQHWDKLENLFEERVARALKRLGVPSAKEVNELIERLNALSDHLDLPKAKPAKPVKAAAKKASKPAPKAAAKPAAKKAAPKAASATPKSPFKTASKAASKTASAPAAAKKALSQAVKAAKPAAKAIKAAAAPAAKKAPARKAAAPKLEAKIETTQA
ncbi:poly(hydroxyalkanoate) granule-associated protein [Paucibacter oligotrophus]|uniref:Poly(Hydroxyalkanoate) granule-associated protein n=1 Tax=Roseateles oligotrophus TaxID=1769250 RepID=A0A840LGP4_9BURK|nr:phasin family protein [Roseateles oligotrophus]MBB4845209.1 poly(hydroxyalkanoate) granule-associated protein [Roseateles oligotrophus]